GGVAATQAAESIRRLCSRDSIKLVAEEDRPFYMRPLLADFVAGRIDDKRLWRDFESTAETNDIELITGRKAGGIDRADRALTLADGSRVPYDRLLVATGVKPRLPQIPGIGLDGVTPFSAYADAVRLAEWCRQAKTAVVVGRGLQGVELTRALRLRGLDVTMVVPDESPWFPQLFQVKGELIEREMERRGVKVIELDRPAELVGREGRVVGVKTHNGREIPADIVGFSVEQRASFDFLVGSGISLADGVVVNARLQSTDEAVFAAGDVAQIEQDGRRRPIGYGWLRAMEQGEAAGRNMAGDEAEVQVGDESEAQALYGMSLLARWD
nr:FAD-dependent oxidoreductase [Gemmatimonadales bacterium]